MVQSPLRRKMKSDEDVHVVMVPVENISFKSLDFQLQDERDDVENDFDDDDEEDCIFDFNF